MVTVKAKSSKSKKTLKLKKKGSWWVPVRDPNAPPPACAVFEFKAPRINTNKKRVKK